MTKDGIVLTDGQDQVTFNQYSFCELIKYLLVELVGISYENASVLVNESHLATPVTDVTQVGLLGHELAYYWAMDLYYGNCYWLKGVPAQPEDLDEYIAQEDRILQRHHLKEPFEWL